uniref:Uncharacterized protein n=1 Tax=Setaria italica TaxID=4555 RepID=K4ANI9_SETIT
MYHMFLHMVKVKELVVHRVICHAWLYIHI